MGQEFWNSAINFVDVCIVYYTIQLIRCVLFSFAVFAFVFLLRKTVLRNRVFLKGALWSLFLPTLFIGRMRFFYENRVGVWFFSGLTELCMSHIWVGRLYLCGIFLYAVLLFYRRRKLKKMVAGMEKRNVGGTFVHVAKAPVTPSAAGLFRPVIIVPEVILKEYSEEEIRLILLHEKTHIRLGHLLFYLLWNVLRVFLWLNPLLATGTKYFREDMEEICDFVTIQKSKGKAYTYGQLLLKSMRILQAEGEAFNMYAAFAGDREYRDIRQRVKRIAGYKPYKETAAASILVAAMLYAAGAVFWMQKASYGRYTLIDYIAVYDMGTGTELISDGKALRQAVRYDESCIYIKTEAFQELIRNSTVPDEALCFYCGGYYKLPGIGGGGCCGYLEAADLEMQDLEDGILKIEYVEQVDIFGCILKML
ncbi:MAG: M56 family metallopeptidase [Lachnospiraceae bacterium]|nr:M56 family metallopeptidase [Lachnospiraceae bacterium]